MVGVQDEDGVERLGDDWIGFVILARIGEHHVQEVFAVIELVARIVGGHAAGVLIAHGGDGGHFGDEAEGANLAVALVLDVQRIVVEG